MDLFPTICEVAGAQPPAGLDGVSILPVLCRGANSLPQRDLVWVRREGGLRYQGQDYYALRRGDWKLLQNNPFEPPQLHNLREDPREQDDLKQREPKIYQELTAALARHLQRAGQTPWQRRA
jgi:arylsulfatase A-like enzyme